MEQQTSVMGILQDASGRPVEDAIVMIAEGSHAFNDIAAVTNEAGEFSLSNITVPGRYILQIQGNDTSFRKEVNVQNSDTIRILFP